MRRVCLAHLLESFSSVWCYLLRSQQIFTGLRVGLGLAWVLVIVAEMLAVQGGLGYALWSAYQFSRLDLILAAIASVGALGLASDRLISLLAARTFRWQTGSTAR